jgi:O-acetyl-ADP-ribose deacetylase (regulator of RNase III)
MDTRAATNSPEPCPNVSFVAGDLLDQQVDAIVNTWNRNLIPYWLLLPQGVSGAIKRRAGTQPFRELKKFGVLPLGGAAITSAGRLPLRGIIHVAGINHLWRASEFSIRTSVRSALALAERVGFDSLAFPAIGAGSGGFDVDASLAVMRDELALIGPQISVTLVRYEGQKQ